MLVRSAYRSAWQAIALNPAGLLFVLLLSANTAVSVAIESSWRSPPVDCLWSPVSLAVLLGAQLGIVQLAIAGRSRLRLSFGQAVRGARHFLANGFIGTLLAAALGFLLFGCSVLALRLGGSPHVPPSIVLIGRLIAIPLYSAAVTFTLAGVISYRLNGLQAAVNAMLVASNNPLATLLLTAPFALARLALDVLILSVLQTPGDALLTKLTSNPLGTLFGPAPHIIAGFGYAFIALFEISAEANAYVGFISRRQYPWTIPEPAA